MSIRDKYKATPTLVLKKVKEEEDIDLQSGRGSDFLSIDDGLNKFRIFPKHEGEETFFHKRGYHWVSYEKDGEIKRTNVPNSRVHGGTEMDMIDEYIKYARLILDASDPLDAKKLKDMVSYPTGIHMSTTWLLYANKIVKNKPDTFGLLEIKKLVRDAMNELSIIEDESEAMEMDPFTDPDEGKPILLTYNPNAKKASDYYKLQLSKNSLPLSEEEFERFEKVSPLSKLSLLQYGITQFETALEGLRIFDEENEIGIFETDEFQEIIETVKAQYDGKAGKDVEDIKTTKKSVVKGKKEEPATKKTVSKKVVVEEEAEDEPEAEEAEETNDVDEYEEMARPDLIKALRALDAEVKIYKSTTDDSLREQIRALVAVDEDEPEAEEAEETEEEVEEVKPVAKKPETKIKTAAAASGGAKLSLADIKNKLKK